MDTDRDTGTGTDTDTDTDTETNLRRRHSRRPAHRDTKDTGHTHQLASDGEQGWAVAHRNRQTDVDVDIDTGTDTNVLTRNGERETS